MSIRLENPSSNVIPHVRLEGMRLWMGNVENPGSQADWSNVDESQSYIVEARAWQIPQAYRTEL